MATVHLKGASARNFFAEELVKNSGPEQALENTCGPMHEAVKRVIARTAAIESDRATLKEEPCKS